MSSSSSSSSSAVTTNEHERNWLDLPSGITENILKRIGVFDILENAQKVCTFWRKICKEPAMWRVIHVIDLMHSDTPIKIDNMCEHAVDRSQGQLVDITMVYWYAYGLLSDVAKRSTQLKRLEIAYGDGEKCDWLFEKYLTNFPLLEEFNLYSVFFSKETIETAGRYCPFLKTLGLNKSETASFVGEDADEVAIDIGKYLHGLTHLELIGNNISNIGLQAILDGCLYLETLDLRNCLSINLNTDLGKRCIEQIKNLKLPDESLVGCPYIYQSPTYKDLDDHYYSVQFRHLFDDFHKDIDSEDFTNAVLNAANLLSEI